MWFDRREPWIPQPDDAREPADVDCARVVHSASFRRLQGKTQILNLGDGDFYRTRLTHSLEVAQIAGGILRQFEKYWTDHPAHKHLPDVSLIQVAGFTHDLGHPPFGHGGEVALNYCMRDHGGFEGNGQTLRILSKLEKFSRSAGANLTRRTLLGVLKYPAPYRKVRNSAISPKLREGLSTICILDQNSSKPPKCYLDSEDDVVEWILRPVSDGDREAFCSIESKLKEHNKPKHKSFDCSIMDLADDIGFGVHDLEDSLSLNFIDQADLREHMPEERCGDFLDALKARYPAEFGNNVYDQLMNSLFGDSSLRKRTIGRMVHYLIASCKIQTLEEFIAAFFWSLAVPCSAIIFEHISDMLPVLLPSWPRIIPPPMPEPIAVVGVASGPPAQAESISAVIAAVITGFINRPPFSCGCPWSR